MSTQLRWWERRGMPRATARAVALALLAMAALLPVYVVFFGGVRAPTRAVRCSTPGRARGRGSLDAAPRGLRREIEHARLGRRERARSESRRVRTRHGRVRPGGHVARRFHFFRDKNARSPRHRALRSRNARRDVRILARGSSSATDTPVRAASLHDGGPRRPRLARRVARGHVHPPPGLRPPPKCVRPRQISPRRFPTIRPARRPASPRTSSRWDGSPGSSATCA